MTRQDNPSERLKELLVKEHRIIEKRKKVISYVRDFSGVLGGIFAVVWFTIYFVTHEEQYNAIFFLAVAGLSLNILCSLFIAGFMDGDLYRITDVEGDDSTKNSNEEEE